MWPWPCSNGEGGGVGWHTTGLWGWQAVGVTQELLCHKYCRGNENHQQWPTTLQPQVIYARRPDRAYPSRGTQGRQRYLSKGSSIATKPLGQISSGVEPSIPHRPPLIPAPHRGAPPWNGGWGAARRALWAVTDVGWPRIDVAFRPVDVVYGLTASPISLFGNQRVIH